MKYLRSCLLIIFLFSLISIVPIDARAQFFMFQNPLVDKEAPEFSVPTLSGREQSFTKFRDGDKAIVFFWATWCPHCRTQLKELNENKEKFEEKDIKIVLVDLGESAKIVRKYMEKNKIDIEVFSI